MDPTKLHINGKPLVSILSRFQTKVLGILPLNLLAEEQVEGRQNGLSHCQEYWWACTCVIGAYRTRNKPRNGEVAL